MPSNALVLFENALVDIDNLMWFHENEGGDGPGKRPIQFSSLNKSAIVLLCAAWESYVEAVVCEAAAQCIDSSATPDAMPKSLKKLVSSHVREGKDESAWQLAAGDGWRTLAQAVVQTRVNALNTPRLGQISDLMLATLGVKDIGNNWEWHKNPLGTPSEKLSDFIRLRGSIAHGEQMKRFIKKSEVTKARELLTKLAMKVEERLVEDELL
jgi:RiboL-PSP-HEPN